MLLAIIASSSEARSQRIIERAAPEFYLAYINLNAAETVTLDTTGCLPGAADPPYLNGAPTFQGNFVIAWSDGRASNGTDVPTMVRLTEVVDRSNPPSASLQGLWEDFLADTWTNNVSTTAASLYSDSTIDNVFGLAVWNGGLVFLTHVDGAPNHTYTTRSDFMVMEDGICGRIRPTTWCGPMEVLE